MAGLDQGAVLQLVLGVLPVNFRIKWLSCDVEVHFDCTGSQKVCVAVLVCGVLPANFCIRIAFVQCPSAFRLRRLAQSVVPGLGLRHFT